MNSLVVGWTPNSLGPIRKNFPNLPNTPPLLANFSLITYCKGERTLSQAF